MPVGCANVTTFEGTCRFEQVFMCCDVCGALILLAPYRVVLHFHGGGIVTIVPWKSADSIFVGDGLYASL